ncbi:hypothetical protein ANO11243_093070 [Dothideomycetidae sp. 11243]|nr:hypothetical protein ANO11243_093070 [fungal sp. No.11243]
MSRTSVEVDAPMSLRHNPKKSRRASEAASLLKRGRSSQDAVSISDSSVREPSNEETEEEQDPETQDKQGYGRRQDGRNGGDVAPRQGEQTHRHQGQQQQQHQGSTAGVRVQLSLLNDLVSTKEPELRHCIAQMKRECARLAGLVEQKQREVQEIKQRRRQATREWYASERQVESKMELIRRLQEEAEEAESLIVAKKAKAEAAVKELDAENECLVDYETAYKSRAEHCEMLEELLEELPDLGSAEQTYGTQENGDLLTQLINHNGVGGRAVLARR